MKDDTIQDIFSIIKNRMKIKNILIFVILLFITSCTQKQLSIVVFEHVKDYELDLTKQGKNIPYIVQIRELDTATILHVYYNYPEIVSYDLKTEKIIEKIDINFFENQQLLSFKYHNKDSIFLFFNAAENSGYNHDSTILMINNKGDINKSYSFEGAPVWCSENPRYPRDSVAYASQLFRILSFYKGKIFVPLKKYTRQGTGDSLFFVNTFPLGGHIDIKQDTFISHHLFEIPFYKIGNYYPKAIGIQMIEISNNGNILYYFTHTDVILEYNLKNKTVISHRAKSFFVDSISPKNKPTENYSDGYYSFMRYNPYRKQYVRTVILPTPEHASNYQKNVPKFSLMLLDTNFNVLAEGIYPENVGARNFMKDGVLSYNRKATMENNDGKIIFSLYKLNVTESTDAELLKQMNETPDDMPKATGILSYLKTVHNFKQSSKSAVILVPIDRSCLSCMNYVCKYYADSLSFFQDNNIFLILSANNPERINLLRKETGIQDNSENLFIDDKNEYLKYIELYTNPKLIFIENNKIVLDSVYNPTALYFLDEDIKTFIKN